MRRLRVLPLAGFLACAVASATPIAVAQPYPPPQGGDPPPYLPPLQGGAPIGPPGYPAGPPPQGFQGSPPMGGQPGGQSGAGRFVERFRAANTTNDGRLTLQQAETAGLTPVIRHFAELDPSNRGFVTLQDVRGYVQRMRAMRSQPNVSQ